LRDNATRKPITLQQDAATITFNELMEELTRFKRLQNVHVHNADRFVLIHTFYVIDDGDHSTMLFPDER
jgi:hypothetical protein